MFTVVHDPVAWAAPTFHGIALDRGQHKIGLPFNLMELAGVPALAFSLIGGILAVAIAVSAWTPAAFAEMVFGAEKYSTPVYNPATKSYFQLVEYPPHQDRMWSEAKEEAESLTFKGVRGRLAVVTSREVHDFLQERLGTKAAAWIGLRYWCQYHKLQWVTGEIHSRNGFSVWHPQWFRNPNVRCGAGESNYMPVYYTAAYASGFLWQACGAMKAFGASYIEYPTGRE